MPMNSWVEISKDNLKNNVNVIRGLLRKGTKLLAVVKANAYGHGLVETAKILASAGVDWFGVFLFEDAITLRRKGIKKPILIVGPSRSEHYSAAARNNIRLTLTDSVVPQRVPAKLLFHLKIDTGLNRQGLHISSLPQYLASLPKNIIIEGLYSHFADAGNFDDQSYSIGQLLLFQKAIETLDNTGRAVQFKHIAATRGLLSLPQAEFDLVRMGIALYGVPPSREFVGRFKLLGLEAVLRWLTTIAQVKNIPKGSAVGYGATERVSRDTTLAVLPIGYWDGFPRALSSVGRVLINGRYCKVLGRVAMNMVMVDATDAGQISSGDAVVLIGSQGEGVVNALNMAEAANTISYEIITRINPLTRRIYI